MRVDRTRMTLLLAALAVLSGCGGESQASTAAAGMPVRKGGDNRYGEYTSAAADWWKPAPDQSDEATCKKTPDECWRWGQVSGVVADNPNRILVGITGDRNPSGRVRHNSSNYIVAVDSMGNIIENWKQWDTLVSFPHQLYVSPYDPERHIWVDERGGGERNIHEQILQFSNDGKQITLRLLDPKPRQSDEEVRANKHPGPLDFGQPATLTFLPNGDFLLADGYQNGRIVRYDKTGKFLSEFGEVGSGPGQFDLVHGVAMDKQHRILVSDRDNNRIQVFSEDGKFIEEWPDVLGPTGIYIDNREHVWVLSTTLNQILEFNLQGQLLYQFGAYCCTRGGFTGGFSRPHQMSVDQNGNLYVANYDGGFVTRYTPRPGADPDRVVGPPLMLDK